MKRFVLLAFVPLVMFALEFVNLIKDAGFEKDSEVWLMRSEADGIYDSTIINSHDPDSAYVGDFCGSIDERIKPWPTLPYLYYITGHIYQIPLSLKRLSDLDSLEFFHMAIFPIKGDKYSSWGYGITLKCFYPNDGDSVIVWYFWIPPGNTPIPDNYYTKVFHDTIRDEGTWNVLKRDLQKDLILDKGLSEDVVLDTFLLFSAGCYYSGWQGQKAFFDGIRLTGYADYDVGVKEILSGDSLWAGVDYTPVARIKNFGREAADDFLVIAEIKQAETLVWADTVPYTLPADTEDTLEFGSFPVPDAASYTLTVRTVMDPDESDEDDVLSKPLYGTGIAEPVTHPEPLFLEVLFPSTIQYSVPYAIHVNLSIYDVTGHLVTKLVDDEVPPGVHTMRWEGRDYINRRCSSGVYFVRMETKEYRASKKMVLLK